MRDIKGLRSSSGSPAEHQEAWQEPSSVSPGHKGGIQGRWGSCSTAQSANLWLWRSNKGLETPCTSPGRSWCPMGAKETWNVPLCPCSLQEGWNFKFNSTAGKKKTKTNPKKLYMQWKCDKIKFWGEKN